MNSTETYAYYRDLFRGQRLPLAFVDLDKFDANVAYVAELARAAGKTIRLGSKSIRCAALMQRILDFDPQVYRGLLTFTVEETTWLAAQGFDDMIVAYPSVQPSDIALLVEMTRAGKQVWLMVDCLEHLRILSAAGRDAGLTLHACLEVDMAYRPLNLASVHLGLRRSPVRTPEQARALVRAARALPSVKIDASFRPGRTRPSPKSRSGRGFTLRGCSTTSARRSSSPRPFSPCKSYASRPRASSPARAADTSLRARPAPKNSRSQSTPPGWNTCRWKARAKSKRPSACRAIAPLRATHTKSAQVD